VRLAIASILVAATALPAHAEHMHPYSPVSATLSMMIRDDHSGGDETTAAGSALELAIGSGRFQYFAEGSIAAIQSIAGGTEVRGGGGIRWLARSFEIGHVALEMHLEGVAGYTRMTRDSDGLHEKYPDVGFGVGWSVRVHDPRILFRISARAVFAQNEKDQMTECPVGPCDRSSSVPGFVALVGLGY
jgi:hypothetical protein